MHIQDNEPVVPSPASNPWRKLVTRRQVLTAAGKGALAIGAGGALSGLVNSSASASPGRGRSAAASGIELSFGIEYTTPAPQDAVRNIVINPFLKAHPQVSAINYTVFNNAGALDSGLKLDFASGTGQTSSTKTDRPICHLSLRATRPCSSMRSMQNTTW